LGFVAGEPGVGDSPDKSAAVGAEPTPLDRPSAALPSDPPVPVAWHLSCQNISDVMTPVMT